jgi:exopolysaccharide biosynthesis WecB/TagA/CpsF family protein
LFDTVIEPTDRIVLIGGSRLQADRVRARYELKNLHHFNPPMGFITDRSAVEATLRFVEANSPFRYCFLAVGSPQQEILAQMLARRGIARGLALCIGASMEFLTGGERRAPAWVQQAGLEWAFRLAQSPRRMARRYLVRGPRIIPLLRKLQVTARISASGATPA